MARDERFAAVSLDLWSTSLIERPDETERLGEARRDFLREHFTTREGSRVSREQLERAERTVVGRIGADGRDPIEVDPFDLLARYAEALGARPTRPLPELGRAYSRIGFDQDIPRANPEAETLVARLEAHGIPVIAISDTARPEESWQEFLRARTRLRFRHIVTSCEVGRAKPDPAIFREATKRLGLSPGAIVHIGDRWDRDVQGALRAGFGAVLYTGLRTELEDDAGRDGGGEAAGRVGVPTFDRLDDPALWALLV